MPKMPKTVSNATPYTFVLWGEQCEEIAAATFVATLRAAWQPVMLVGLSGRSNAGCNGVTLLPDAMLGEVVALADRAQCIIVPCQRIALRGFLRDPRLVEFLQRLNANGALFLMQHEAAAALTELGILPTYQLKVPEDKADQHRSPPAAQFIENQCVEHQLIEHQRIAYPPNYSLGHLAQALAQRLAMPGFRRTPRKE